MTKARKAQNSMAAINIDINAPVAGWVPNLTDDQLITYVRAQQAAITDANTKLGIAQAVLAARSASTATGPTGATVT